MDEIFTHTCGMNYNVRTAQYLIRIWCPPEDAQLLKEVICERCEAAFKDTEPSTMFIQEESPAVA